MVVISSLDFEYVYSPLLRLEVVLHPEHSNRRDEAEFFGKYFSRAMCWGDLNRMFEIGEREARENGIQALDALHIATANLARCRYFFTSEKLTSHIYKTKLVQAVRVTAQMTALPKS